MCCFSRPIRFVSDTSIFTRLDGPRQAVVYAMQMSADEDLAMVLPIPTPPASPEDAVAFVSLEAYDRFFPDMESGFPLPVGALELAEPTRSASQPQLKVQTVGAFDASFVPAQDDFDRLDERFRIPKAVWSTVPLYEDYGFAVFKLRKGERQKVHPMAFWFPTRHPDRLCFPTVHIHHGAWTPEAHFDHALYAQVEGLVATFDDPESPWMPSSEPARFFLNIGAAEGLVDPARHVYRRTVVGTHPNEDVFA